MGKYLGFIGGFLAIVGVVASLFIEILAWYTLGPFWLNAIGGGTAGIIADPIEIFTLLPGIIAILGAIICLIPKKMTILIGSLLVLIGVGLFIYILYSLTGDFSFFWAGPTAHIGYGAIITTFGGILAFIGTFVGEEN